MTRRDILKSFGVTAAALLATSCAFLRSCTYRYRLTVVMAAAGKEYAGSGVIEVKRQKGLNVIGAYVKGEAIVIDLGTSGKAFATLVDARGGEGWPEFVAHKAFADQLGTWDMVNEGALDKMPSLVGYKSRTQCRKLSPDRAVQRYQRPDKRRSHRPIRHHGGFRPQYRNTSHTHRDNIRACYLRDQQSSPLVALRREADQGQSTPPRIA